MIKSLDKQKIQALNKEKINSNKSAYVGSAIAGVVWVHCCYWGPVSSDYWEYKGRKRMIKRVITHTYKIAYLWLPITRCDI